MKSGVPQNFDAAFIAGLDNLIKKVEVIDEGLNPHEDFSALSETKTFDDYCAWLNEVQGHFNTDDLKQYLPHNFYYAEKILVPKLRFDEQVVGNKAHNKKLREFRTMLHEVILKNISAIEQAKENYGKRQKQIVIHVETNGVIWRDDPEKYFHKSTNGQTKRVRMLRAVAKNKTRIRAHTLMKDLMYGSISTLSREKSKLNEKLREHLRLSQDVILGGDHTRNNGYVINPAFLIRIETKKH